MPEQTRNIPNTKRKRKKKNNFFKYLLLFFGIFCGSYYLFSYFVDSYSPDVDVQIGNKQSVILNDEDMMLEEKSIDERLKWIKEEDDLPSAGANEPKLLEPKMEKPYIEESDEDVKKTVKQVIEKPVKKNYDETLEKEKEIKVPIPKKDKIDVLKADFRRAAENSSVIPKPLPPSSLGQTISDNKTKPSVVYKVFIGNFTNVEDATATQNKVSSENLNVFPFVKSVHNYYVVQIGSFSDKEKAYAINSHLRGKGYSSRVITEQ